MSCVNQQKEGALTPEEAWAARSPMPLMQWENLVPEFQHRRPLVDVGGHVSFSIASHRRSLVGSESGVEDFAWSSVSKAGCGLDGHGDERAITVAASL